MNRRTALKKLLWIAVPAGLLVWGLFHCLRREPHVSTAESPVAQPASTSTDAAPSTERPSPRDEIDAPSASATEPPVAAPASASTDAARSQDRSSLDHEIEALSKALSAASNQPKINGWIRARFAISGDVDVDAVEPGEQDLGGFNLDNARIAVSGQAADGYAYTVSIEAGDPAVSDAAGSDVALLDAYVAVRLSDRTSMSIGRFGSTFLWRASLEERRMLFLDRSFLGEVWDGRDVGLELSGSIGRLDWWTAAQNGLDSQAGELALSASACYSFLENELYLDESRLGADERKYLTLSLGWFDDTSLDDGAAIGGGVHAAQGRWSASAELVDFGEDLQPSAAINPATGVVIPSALAPTGAETSWNTTLGYMLVPGRWELAARWEDVDDDAGTSILSAALTRYVADHDAKWTLQYDTSNSEDAALGADTIAVGLTVGF